MNKLSLSIAILLSTFFSPRIFSANLLDDQKEGDFSTQPNNQVQQPKQVYDYTILNHKNINHTFDDIEDVEDDLGYDVSAVNQKLVTTNDQSPPLLLGVVLRHEKTHEYHQYLITSTGLLSKATQLNAVKRAHKKRFHLIKATRGHVGLQLLEWLQISKYYSVTALHTNRPVCRNCYLIAYSLWEKKLKTNEKGCIEAQFSVLDKMPNLAQQYINTHLNLSLVQNLVVPIMGYVSKEEMNKAIEEKDEKINMLNKEVNKKDNQLNDKNNTISSLTNVIKENQQKIAELQNILEEIPKKTLDDNTKKELFKAIEKSNVKKLKEFLYTYKNIVNVRDEYDRTPFLCAAEKGQLGIAKLLKKRGANINAKSKMGNNALHLACLFSGNVAMVIWLLDVCKLGMESRGNAHQTPFLSAARKGELGIAKLLKKCGANINAKDKDGDSALHLACLFSESVAMVTWLLDKCKIGLETKGYYQKTPFLCASEKGQLEIAKLLKQCGANLSAKNESGNNALHFACLFSESVAMVTWLLDVCHIDIETRGNAHQTSFLCAARQGQLEIAKLLKKQGANINAKTANGSNALHWACYSSESVAMVTWLLDECELGLETKGDGHQTPFLFAAKEGKLAIAKLLKQRGANIHARDLGRHNALYLAKERSNNEEMISYLQTLGLKDDTN